MTPARPTYHFDVEGHTVVVEEPKQPEKKKHPFILSESPSIDERYFYWYFSEGQLWELPLKAVLLVPTLFVMLVIEPIVGGSK